MLLTWSGLRNTIVLMHCRVPIDRNTVLSLPCCAFKTIFSLQWMMDSAAFDIVDHNILISRLRDFIGLRGSALQWCQSYLSNRPEYVRVGNSSSTPVVYAVPQGSVPGIQWFTVYTYPVGTIIQKHNLQYHIYAGDTQFSCLVKPLRGSSPAFARFGSGWLKTSWN